MTLKHAGLGLLLLFGLTLPVRAEDGVRSFCRWEADGFFYHVTIEKRENGKCFVRYTMDGTTEWVPDYRFGNSNIEVGDRLSARWWKDKLFYGATVIHRNGEKLSIRYDDGSEEETNITQVRIRALNPNGRQVGEPVLARWQAGRYWFTGKIQEIRDGKYHVHFDDGDEAWLTADDMLPYLPTFGDSVDAKWSRDGKYYAARIVSRNGDKLRVEFEDGINQETTMRDVRVETDRLPFRPSK